PALGAEADIEEGRGMERRLLERRQRAVLGVMALPSRLAAMEVAIDPFLRPAVEARDRGGERLRIETDLERKLFQRVGGPYEVRILGGIHRRQPVGVARIEDAPHR